MAVIAGVIGTDFGPPESALRLILASLERHGKDGSGAGSLGPAHFGVKFHHALHEDDFDAQPYIAAGGRFLLASDCRVDNREEIAVSLGMDASELREMSDCQLIARGWERWNLALCDRLLGDFALAVWDRLDGRLTLARSPLSSRPLFFRRTANTIAFASMPAALLSLPAAVRAPNMDELERHLAGGLFLATSDSFFSGVQQVPQGKAMVLDSGSLREIDLWAPGEHRLKISAEEAGDMIRQQLDRSVRAQARRRSGPLGCMLSSGRDSSAVAVAVALLEDSATIALTAAPGRPVTGLPAPWIADESELASQTARQLGVRHEICRSQVADLGRLLDEVAAVHFQPFNNPVNLPWISQLCTRARMTGAEAVMTGACGNFTVSLGGPAFLPDLWRDLGLVQWLESARRFRAGTRLSWPQILAHSFGGWIPREAYGLLRSAGNRPCTNGLDLPLLRQPFRRRAEEHRRSRFGDPRPKRNGRRAYAGLVKRIEPGDKYSLACWGVDMRDPTADRRLAEICLSLPVEALAGSGPSRPAFQWAFGDALPKPIVDGVHRGAQSADWYATVRPSEVADSFRRYAQHPLVDDIFDLAAVEQMIERWPSTAAAADMLYDQYCNQLLGGLSVAAFINAHFPG